MKNQPLLQPTTLGDLQLKNRMVLAPMTRNRAGEGLAPTPLNAEYYRQRSTAGLLITEATQVTPMGMGYPNTPGIYSTEQVAGWRLVTDAVHQADSRIIAQLWHVGRISHSSFHNGALPVAPSAINPGIQVFTYQGLQDTEVPRALDIAEIPELIAQFKHGAQMAKDAGFDGVEVHGANGYLLNQFLEDISNHRTDSYGGSVEHRARLLFEVLDAVLQVWPSQRVGIRLSPSGVFNTMGDSNPHAIYDYVIERLNGYNLAYLYLMNPMAPIDHAPQLEKDVIGTYGSLYKGTLMVNGGFTRETGNAIIDDGKAQLVSFGALYLANPDLPQRFEVGAELNTPDQATFYGGDAKGYTDYPTLQQAAV